MKVDRVDALYLRLPEVRDIGDGSQDALLIRIEAGGFVGWGECEASPLTTIAALVAPMSHSACKPVLGSVLGMPLNDPSDIARISSQVKANSYDIAQCNHALSGIDIALWDLIAKARGVPVWELLTGVNQPRLAYASRLFGDTPEQTFELAAETANVGFRAAKFGWGPIGLGSLAADEAQIESARAGLGPDRALLVDTGCAFGHDVERAALLVPVMEASGVGWWEEPFAGGALDEYSALAARTGVPLAGGEGCHDPDQARNYLRYAGVKFIQIDAGRVGGITAAQTVAFEARRFGASYVNHTFTSNLALGASLAPFSDSPAGSFAEVPFRASALAVAIGGERWPFDSDGCILPPASPGLGVPVDEAALTPYLQDLEIRWNGRVLCESEGGRLRVYPLPIR